MTKTLLPALAASAAVALHVPPSAEAHSLYKPGWWKGKTPSEVAERQRGAIAHDRAAIRFFKARPGIRGPKRDGIVRWHRTHLRVTKRELAETLAAIEASRRAAAEAAAQATASASATSSSSSTSSAGGYASAATATCESGGNPSAVSADGRYRGKWQFDQQTWDAHAPSGWQGVDPASAPESVQDQAAASVPYDAWPNC
jgi:Transglycosylase-like domain